MNKIVYKGYIIHPTPNLLKTSEEWSTEICISKHRERGVAERKYYAKNTYKSEAEATQMSIEFGIKIIDGEILNCTVKDL